MTSEQPSPPPIPSNAPEVASPRVSRGRWWIHLLLLAAYPLTLGVLGFLHTRESTQPMLPKDSAGLLIAAAFELVTFGVIFGIAWACSRVSAAELHVPWRGGARPIVRGFFYAIGFRLAIMLALFVAIAFALIFGLVDLESLKSFIEKNGPKVDKLVDPSALASDPVYLTLNLTLISFIVAGLREELWRAGLIAGLIALFPKRFSSVPGRIAAITIAAVIFGLGHLPQGWMAVGIIGLLGFGLGAVLVFHRSLWDAVLAHGFFNAASFGMMYWLARTSVNAPPVVGP